MKNKLSAALPAILVFFSQGCSLESARSARINSQLKAGVAASPSKGRSESECHFLDTVHVWGDWGAGTTAAIGTGAGVIVASTHGDTQNAAVITGIAAGAVTATLVAVASKSEATWTEHCAQ